MIAAAAATAASYLTSGEVDIKVHFFCIQTWVFMGIVGLSVGIVYLHRATL
jgi:hypothetical protein